MAPSHFVGPSPYAGVRNATSIHMSVLKYKDMIISLIGFMGCGKSSVGRRLSELLGCPFMDLDQIIEEAEGRSIPGIFATDGEAAFRQVEQEALRTVIGQCDNLSDSKRHLVIALGGGTVMTSECAEIVHSDTTCIYLKTSVDTLLAHLEGETADRPLLNAPSQCEESEGQRGNPVLHDRITALMALRASTYEKTAHIIIDTDGKSIETIASEIINLYS